VTPGDEEEVGTRLRENQMREDGRPRAPRMLQFFTRGKRIWNKMI
jgi:hypothetical protein